MVPGWVIFASAIGYLMLLFCIASFGDRMHRIQGEPRNGRPIVYALSLAIYCTSWTYFGGVGLAAVELGKAFGARVVAAVSSEEKAAAARAAGADEALVYGRAPFDKDQSKALAEQFKAALGPQGADVIYDPVGGDYAEPALRSIAWEGRYLVTGFPAGIPHLPLNLTLLKACDVRGVFWGGFVSREPERHRAHVRELLHWWQNGQIKPRIDRVFPLADGGAAIARLANRSAIGKVVVRLSQDD